MIFCDIYLQFIQFNIVSLKNFNIMLLFLQVYNIKISFIRYLFNVLFIWDIYKNIKNILCLLKYHDVDTKYAKIQVITKNCRILR